MTKTMTMAMMMIFFRPQKTKISTLQWSTPKQSSGQMSGRTLWLENIKMTEKALFLLLVVVFKIRWRPLSSRCFVVKRWMAICGCLTVFCFFFFVDVCSSYSSFSFSSSFFVFVFSVFLQIDHVGRPSWQAQLSGAKRWLLEPPLECYADCADLVVDVHEGDTSKLARFLKWKMFGVLLRKLSRLE